MKSLICLIAFICISFPAFSQTSNTQRFRALADTMSTTLTKSTEILADFDSRASTDGSVKRYVDYLGQFRFLDEALQASEFKLNFLLRGHAHSTQISDEHKNYERLLNSLEALKSDYDTWLGTVQ